MKRLLKFVLSLFAPAPPPRRPPEPAPMEQKADLGMLAAQRAQDEAEKRNLAARQAAKLQAMREWSDPEAVKLRHEQHVKDAAKALAAGQQASREIREQLGLPLEDPPLPPQDQLPKEMRGQAESTTRAMLRQQGWKWQDDGWRPPRLQGIRLVENPPCPWRAPTDETATPAQRKARALMGLDLRPKPDGPG